MTLHAELLGLIPDESRVSVGESILDAHSRDLTYHPGRVPDAVVFPRSTEEVARVLAYANGAGIPVVAFGAGTSLEGHTIPVCGGIVLDLTRMDAILELRLGDERDLRLKLAVVHRVLPLLDPQTLYLDVSVPERPVAGTTLKSKLQVEGLPAGGG